MLAPQSIGKLVASVDLAGPWRDLGVGERTYRIAQCVDVFTELEVEAGRVLMVEVSWSVWRGPPQARLRPSGPARGRSDKRGGRHSLAPAAQARLRPLGGQRGREAKAWGRHFSR